MTEKATGYFRSGLPYTRLGHGPRPLVVVQGLTFENKPQPAVMIQEYRALEEDYTVWVVLRRPGLLQGCGLKEMADDYAAMIQEEFGGPVDVIGVSTGGSIVHHLAADHPEVVRRLVIHSSAYTLSEPARRLQMDTARLAQQGKWRQAYITLLGPVMAHANGVRHLARPVTWLMSALMALRPPKDANDLAVTVEAEDRFNFRDRLAEIGAPTLVIAGEEDPFYTPELFRETAEGIPNARLILYPGMGHPARGVQFGRDLLAFLRE